MAHLFLTGYDHKSDEKVDFTLSKGVEVMLTFDVMGLREDLLRGIYAYGRPACSLHSSV